ncbi:MAG: sulfate ABC transporter ATP-binding protein [Planctomycetes bacterium]|nr:sulfate ABC transporter ATP-binding protein [Planctomycetota bacterium]
MSIEVRHLRKTFGAFVALDDVSLTVPSGELIALLGPSGSGKTSLLRIIGGLDSADSGEVLFLGGDARSDSRDRRVGFVFQHYALFRHMTVFENVAFGLRVRERAQRPSPEKIRDRVHELLSLVQLDGLASRFPSELSGGQRQRVALARALAVEPKVLLLDEPFGSLDAKVRKELRTWLRRLHDELHVTSLFVTHDQEEALEVADRVVVMNRGKVEQVGTPDEVYHQPATPFVCDFLGTVNFFHARVEEGRMMVRDRAVPLAEAADARGALVYVRPHNVDVDVERRTPNHFRARVEHVNRAGPVVKLRLSNDWLGVFHAELSPARFAELRIERGSDVYVTPKDMKVFIEKPAS